MLTMNHIRELTDQMRTGRVISQHEAWDFFARLLVDLHHCASFLMNAEYAESLEAMDLFATLPGHAGRLRFTPEEANEWSAIVYAGKGLTPFGVREHFPLVLAFWTNYQPGQA